MEKRIFYNYTSILKKLAEYLPSRGLVILNSFFILPIFAYILSPYEVSVYLIALQVLNIFCTCSFDWTSKAVLRFYEKYNIQGRLNVFLSTIFWLSVIVYVILFCSYFVFKDILQVKFAVNNVIFLLTLFLVIPCGIRQTLYNILRIKNNYSLYTISIILYQFLFVAGFLAIVNVIPNAISIMIAMITAIFVIDAYIMFSIKLKYPIERNFDKNIVYEILKYSLPLVVTNICYWSIFNIPKFIFQASNQYLNTSIYGISWSLASGIIAPLAGLFMFVNFPVIIKNFEKHRAVKDYFTNVIQLYLFILTPIICGLFFFSKDIVKLIFPSAYAGIGVLIPIFAVVIFLHELLKLFNIKYHLNIKTHIEMIIGIITVLTFVFLTLNIFEKYSILLAALIMLVTEIVLIFANIFVKFKNQVKLEYLKLLRNFLWMITISVISALLSNLVFNYNFNMIIVIKVVLYLVLSYVVFYTLRRRVLD